MYMYNMHVATLQLYVIFYLEVESEQDQFLGAAMLALQDHVGRDWFTFGLHLGVDVRVLNRLNNSYLKHMDYQVSTREMLTAWMDKFDREATWDKIVAALRKIGNNALAHHVQEQYIQPTVQADISQVTGSIEVCSSQPTLQLCLPKIPDGARRGYTFKVSDFQNSGNSQTQSLLKGIITDC